MPVTRRHSEDCVRAGFPGGCAGPDVLTLADREEMVAEANAIVTSLERGSYVNPTAVLFRLARIVAKLAAVGLDGRIVDP